MSRFFKKPLGFVVFFLALGGVVAGSAQAQSSYGVQLALTSINPQPAHADETITLGFGIVPVGDTADNLPTGTVTVQAYLKTPDGLVFAKDCHAVLPAASCVMRLTEVGAYDVFVSYPGDSLFAATQTGATKLYVIAGGPNVPQVPNGVVPVPALDPAGLSLAALLLALAGLLVLRRR